MIELFGFQRDASDQIADRFREYISDPVQIGTRSNPIYVPFVQTLASVTASGKTVILADAVATMCSFSPIAPVVLWLSKGRVVVEQTYANLSPSGKYHHLFGEAEFRTLAEYDSRQVAEANIPQIFFATVGTFNDKDQGEGSRLIYRSDLDVAKQSTWESLKLRRDSHGNQRPLIVVYDEAHNLSDQQTELLMELAPQAFVLASATMVLPQRIGDQIERIKEYAGKDADWFITHVIASEVADSGLIKNRIILGGYRTPMEETVGTMLADLAQAEAAAIGEGLAGRPKAIYVCNTNIVDGNAFLKDDGRRPFTQREAPPILIWRYLVEVHKIDPRSIAVYASLKVNKDFPLPDEFVLFSGGEKDYAQFTAGNYQHIIFNLGLQEGWDDPLCYFAYIDKGMESKVQIEQVIGRVLRQPQAQHFPSDRLNTAHFYIKVDRNEVFNEVLSSVRKKLVQDAPDIRIITRSPGKPAPEQIDPKGVYLVPATARDSEEAVEPIERLLDGLMDYRHDDGANTQSDGQRLIVTQQFGGDQEPIGAWETFGLTATVSARWIFHRAIRAKCPGAIGLALTSDPKFDAMVGFNSKAHAHIEAVASQVVDEYIDNTRIVQRKINPFKVGSILIRREDFQPFTNAIHEGYDGLNPSLELPFAQALDETGLTWCRNPSQVGYGVPLISLGATRTFYPDFLVWKDDAVIAIDTTGRHLLLEKTGRKLLSINPSRGDTQRIEIRLVSEDKYNGDVVMEGKGGFTLWDRRQDGTIRARHQPDVASIVALALRP